MTYDKTGRSKAFRPVFPQRPRRAAPEPLLAHGFDRPMRRRPAWPKPRRVERGVLKYKIGEQPLFQHQIIAVTFKKRCNMAFLYNLCGQILYRIIRFCAVYLQLQRQGRIFPITPRKGLAHALRRAGRFGLIAARYKPERNRLRCHWTPADGPLCRKSRCGTASECQLVQAVVKV